jgi:hypothetical protein
MSPLLDLTDREDADFSPVPAGKYRATVHEAEERATGGSGKLPEGTPMIAIQWKLEEALFETEENIENRRVFSQNVVPPKEIDGAPYKNYKLMNGIIFRLLESLGYSEEVLSSGEFELDYDDMKGREAILTVGRYEYEDPDTAEKTVRNNVKGFRPVREEETSGIL